MNALWPSGEATVRDIQEALRPTRPRAYTTIMTILDRLAQKGIVHRRKVGRAWVYQASVSADEARTHAVSQVVDGFFAGSAAALASHLAGHEDRPAPVHRALGSVPSSPEERRMQRSVSAVKPAHAPKTIPTGLDTTLL
jgi:predicted transcriptional regulator